MAKFKPAGTRKVKDQKSNKGLIPCSILIIAAFAFISYLFYEILRSGVK